MIIISILVFALAAVLGIMMARRIFANRPLTSTVVYSHGIFAVAALTLLIIYCVRNPENFPLISLILFSVAALGGLFMFVKSLISTPGPKVLVLIHAGAAIAAFILLVFFAVNH